MQSALLFGCGNHQRHFKWVYKIGFKNGAAFLGGLKRAARNASANGGGDASRVGVFFSSLVPHFFSSHGTRRPIVSLHNGAMW